MTARFWVFENGGWIKLSIKPGDGLCWHWSARHEEGWSAAEHCWRIEGNRVVEEWSTDGRDCDGRLGSSGVRTCRLDELALIPIEEQPAIRRPAWERGRTVINDHSARAAGY